MFIVTGDGYYRNEPSALYLISTFLLHQLSFQLSCCKNMPDVVQWEGCMWEWKKGRTTYGKIEYIGTTDLWKTTHIHIFPQHKNYINPYTFFVFEIRKLYLFIYYPVLYNKGPSWSWSNLVGFTTIYYICNQCLSPLTVWVRVLFMWGVFDTTLCDKVCQWRDRSVVFSGFLHPKNWPPGYTM